MSERFRLKVRIYMQIQVEYANKCRNLMLPAMTSSFLLGVWATLVGDAGDPHRWATCGSPGCAIMKTVKTSEGIRWFSIRTSTAKENPIKTDSRLKRPETMAFVWCVFVQRAWLATHGAAAHNKSCSRFYTMTEMKPLLKIVSLKPPV